MMNRYTDTVLWSSTLKTQFQLEGYHDYPKPNSSKLPIPSNTKRESEVLLMAMMYKNNLLNSSLYKLGKVVSPLCSLCATEEETADHILFRCRSVNEDLRKIAFTKYRLANNLGEEESTAVDFIDLINTSRNKQFIISCINILCSIDLNVTVDLT